MENIHKSRIIVLYFKLIIIISKISLSIFLLSIVAPSTGMARSESPRITSCRIVAAVIKNKTDTVTTALNLAASHWPDIERKKLTTFFIPRIELYNYSDGGVYKISELDKYLQEHLLVISTAAHGIVYIRITYERFGNSLRLARMTFESEFHKITKTPILQTPEKIECT